ncbi:hypothetical protein P9X10_00715 [Bacillus cereus]|nr:hypothetical protein [Bacillus cereus]
MFKQESEDNLSCMISTTNIISEIGVEELFYRLANKLKSGVTVTTTYKGKEISGMYQSLTNLFHKDTLELVLELEDGREVEIDYKMSSIQQVIQGDGVKHDSYTMLRHNEVVPIVISN